MALSDRRRRDNRAPNGCTGTEALADRRLYAIDDAAWMEFLAMLDRPMSHKPRLAQLLTEPSPFGEA